MSGRPGVPAGTELEARRADHRTVGLRDSQPPRAGTVDRAAPAFHASEQWRVTWPSSQKPAPADDGASEGQEGIMGGRVTSPADAQPAEVVQPGEGALHDPQPAPQPGAVLGPAAGDHGLDAAARHSERRYFSWS